MSENRVDRVEVAFELVEHTVTFTCTFEDLGNTIADEVLAIQARDGFVRGTDLFIRPLKTDSGRFYVTFTWQADR